MSETKQYIINYYLTLSPEKKIDFVQQLIQKYISESDIQISKTESESDFFMQYLFADDTEHFLQDYQKKIHHNTKKIFSKIQQLQKKLTLKVLHAKEEKEQNILDNNFSF